MKRKLVRQGAATMMVSLPAKWVKANKLDKGEEVELEESGNNLVISLEGKKAKSETEISLSTLTESSIRTLITNTYRLGYNKIKINFSDNKALKTIQEVIKNNLIGFEIIKKSDKSCEIENITEPSAEQFDNIFSKILLNIDELFETAEKMLQGKKQEFEETEQKIQQYDNFCRRVISKRSIGNNTPLRWAFHAELIHAQRELYLMLRFLSKNKIKVDKLTLNLLEQCKKIFGMLKQAYEEKNIALLEKMHDMEKEIIYKQGYNILKKSKESIVIHHILSTTRNFYLASSPLIGFFIIGEG